MPKFACKSAPLSAFSNFSARTGRQTALALALLGGLGSAQADVAVQVTSDTVHEMTGTITGALSSAGMTLETADNPLPSGDFLDIYAVELTVLGTQNNWSLTPILFQAVVENSNHVPTGAIEWGISLAGTHLVGPHPGEAAPNANTLAVWYYGLDGLSIGSQLSHKVAHDGHWDWATLTITDLAPGSASYLGAGPTLNASFTLTHAVPEPAESALMLAGLGALAALRRPAGTAVLRRRPGTAA